MGWRLHGGAGRARPFDFINRNAPPATAPRSKAPASSPPLAGDDFKANWNGQQLGDLFEKMRLSMPADHPGKLNGDQNADILAYMLKQNGFPAGSAALKGDADVLKSIRFDAVKPK